MQKVVAPIVDRKIRFALAGCGRISANHFGALREHATNAELVGVCDVDPAALAKAVAATGARGYASLPEMLAETTADVVILSTPSGLHARQGVMVAESGRHVMTEKPMATNWADAQMLFTAAESANVHLFVVLQNRRNATLQLLKKAIDTGRFGRIYMVTINVFWNRPDSYYQAAPWRGTWALDGGALMNQASHYVDLVNWLIGPVESVFAYTGTLVRKIEAEDTGVIAVRWRSGAMGSVNVTMLTYPKNLEGTVTVIGDKGTVRVGGLAVNEIQHWEFAEPHPDDERVKEASYQTTSVYGFGHPLYYENVIKVLRGEAQPDTDGREGMKSLEILVAAYRSARDGVRVALPLIS
jgi:UDP-N-acetyl-2-amino-2-deoxyglucuronate dehydrogenase